MVGGEVVICYKDMTFCTAKDCANKCDRYLTDKIRAEADTWWGKEGAPIMVYTNPKKLECFKEVKR
jgi:hypothetical protein